MLDIYKTLREAHYPAKPRKSEFITLRVTKEKLADIRAASLLLKITESQFITDAIDILLESLK